MKYTPAEVTNIKVGSFFVTVNKGHISLRRRWCSRRFGWGDFFVLSLLSSPPFPLPHSPVKVASQ